MDPSGLPACSGPAMALSEFQPSQNTGSSMAKLPSKARPCFVSTLVRDVLRASSHRLGCCLCLQQAGCTLLGAYRNIPDITKQRATVILPGDLLQPVTVGERAKEFLPQQTPEHVSSGFSPQDCILLRADTPGWCRTVRPHWSNEHRVSGGAGGWGQC